MSKYLKGTVIVTGGNGQLGRCLFETHETVRNSLIKKHTDYDWVFPGHDELDITNIDSINNYISQYDDVKYIINCAAYTNVEGAENVDGSELSVNTYGVDNLAKVCIEKDIFLIHFGSDYMYDRYCETVNTLEPISEMKTWDSQCMYGLSKIKGCRMMRNRYGREKNNKYLIINVSWLYSAYGKNFVKTVINSLNDREKKDIPITVVNDQIGIPTNAHKLSKFIFYLIEHDGINKILDAGLFMNIINFTSLGTCTWYDIAMFLKELVGDSEREIYPCLTDYNANNVRRPKYSVLSTDRLISIFGYDFCQYWRTEMEEFYFNYISN